MKNAKTIDIVERERESYNLEGSFLFKCLFLFLNVKYNVCLSCSSDIGNLIIEKLYKKQKVDVQKVRNKKLKVKVCKMLYERLKTFNNTS